MTPLVVAIVPARGNSVRIPGKNMVAVGGRPLLMHTLDACRNARRLAGVWVSTDSRQISACARAAGAGAIERPAELAIDTAPTEPALLHALPFVEAELGRPVDAVMLLQATSPLRTARSIDDAIQLFDTTQCDSVVGVCRDLAHHYYGELVAGRFVAPYDPAARRRSQELEPGYRENGALYLTSRTFLVQHEVRMGGDCRPFVMSRTESIDIDSYEELNLVRAILYHRDLVRGTSVLAAASELARKVA